MSSEYRMEEGGLHHRFSDLRTKFQLFGGGFGNGKTAAACALKALPIARDYPGANILIARSTYPKLNDTIRKEFLKWCPAGWIKSFPRSKNSDNTCTLTNGTTINFRYIAQQGKGADAGEQTTSNLLSATYDLIIVDQIEDPEIVEKDYLDLFGRLRGNAKYIGNDPTMPLTGPRWFVACTNPTRNWVYQKLVRPLKTYEETGIIDKDLLCKRERLMLPDGTPNPKADEPILDANGKPDLLIGLVEGSTYENAANVGADFIDTLESTYKGKMRDRFLYGNWAAYDGLIYPEFSELTHVVTREQIVEYYNMLVRSGYDPEFVEGYDYGGSVPSCYLQGFVDHQYNVIVCEGFYKPTAEFDIQEQQKEIWRIRNMWGIGDNTVYADPATLKKVPTVRKSDADTIAKMFAEGLHGVKFKGADNSVAAGIAKMSQYLAIDKHHRNPFTKEMGSPRLFYNQELQFVQDEFGSYFWKKDSQGNSTDTPVDKNDHAMDTTKYLLHRMKAIRLQPVIRSDKSYLTQWSEGGFISAGNSKGHRHG